MRTPPTSSVPRPLPTKPTFRSFASSSSSGSSSSSATFSNPSKAHPLRLSKRWPRLALTLLGVTIPTSYYFFPSARELAPHMYSDQPVSSTKSISTQHKLVSIPIPSSSTSKEYFTKPYRTVGSLADVEGGEIVIQHMMIKSPDIQIERPYTPINDPLADGEVRLVVKRVQGGEVGRIVHSLKEGDKVGIRGPIPTYSIYPQNYDKIIMISTGTAISPFLQLLSKLPSPAPIPSQSQSQGQGHTQAAIPSTAPKLHLIHSKPMQGREDWANSLTDSSFLPSLQDKFGDRLQVTRIDPGPVPKAALVEALNPGSQAGAEKDRILVLVCLPPMLMRPLCGNMTPNLDQGPITGILGEMGLTNEQVWKLE
ncbi:uncharacterized protein I303_104339 [Kwoniella dejecticola CBS 10117]|uniref:FAD-binding FR-type domain-containing protein n=1 Tax=Kwoniella dejecticola CBS 10117 TaxID=1296121 RepID=A0A1A6A5L9_9TREE|nr:uncharacterized protein I303_04686 [Kwoniella dejecticola CBS 10117]OBR85351.1 hypothetical protein I303_04686 [Kwoniella dejecticola CBS 10117]